jgi:hypothetical protein
VQEGQKGERPPWPQYTQVWPLIQIAERRELEERCKRLEILLEKDLPEEKVLRACPLTLLSLLVIGDARGRMVSSESDEE